MTNLLVRFVATSVFAVTWVLVWQQILYASTLPGEGFTASILTLLVVLLQFAVLGPEEAARRMPPRAFRLVLGSGAVLLLILMALPLAWGEALLTVFEIPLGSHVLSSTTLFDVAMYAVVSGGMLTAFTSIERTGP